MKKINDYEDKIGKLKPGYFSYFTSQATLDEMDKLEKEKISNYFTKKKDLFTNAKI